MQAKIFLLSAFILASFVRDLNCNDVQQNDPRNAIVSDETRKNNFRQCYCVPVNYPGMKVTEFLSPNGNHKGRLVVYLYKDQNNQLIAYVPNLDKQDSLPDFNLDTGEKLEKLTDSAVKDLFETSPSVVIPVPKESIIAYPNIAKHVPGYTYIPFGISGHVKAPPMINEMIDLKEPEVTSITKQIIKNNGLEPEQIPNGVDTLNVNDENLGMTDPISQPQIVVPQVNPSVENSSVSFETPPIQTDSLIFPGTGNMLSPEDSHLGEYEPTQMMETELNLLPLGHDTSNLNPNENKYVFPDQQLTKVINNGQLQPGTLEVAGQVPDMSSSVVKPNGNIGYIVDPSGIDGKHFISGNDSPLQVSTQPVITTHPGKNLEPYLAEQYIPGVNSQYDLSYNLPKKDLKDFFLTQNVLNQYPDYAKWILPDGERPPKQALIDKTFDQWLLEQVRLLQVHKPFMYHSINKNSLKILIENTLRDNGISVSSSGILIDSYGQPIRMDNLQLRPVLLGDPTLYRNLMESNKCITPHSIPYLEAVLVTLNYPPRILGIIYLGQADLIDPYTITHQCNSGLCSQTVTCSNGRCNSIKNTPAKGLLGSFSRRANIEDKDAPVQEIIPDSYNTLFKVENVKSDTDQNAENVKRLDKTNSGDEDVNNSAKEIEAPASNVDDNDGLGIRIIGGQPATASGIPLVSRGRR